MKMIWIEVLIVGVITGFLIGFLLSLIVKWDIAYRFDAKMRRQGSPARFCFFCVAFWMSVAYVSVYVAYAGTIRAEFIFAWPIATMIGLFVRLPYQS